MNHAIAALAFFVLMIPLAVFAQHEHHAAPRPDTAKSEQHKTSLTHAHGGMRTMSNALLPGVAMQRDGSGTAWLSDAAPVYAVHARVSQWHVMLHGNVTLRYTAQDAFERGERGARRFDSPNWFMAMGQHELGTNRQLTLRGMISLEPFTVGEEGYPLLFQTGETFQNMPLIDRQHPHDLFMELAAIYGESINNNAGFFAYFGFPGEPALGPVAFMHRPATRHNPSSPISHHWQDATHITFGVGTLGLRYGMFKLDGSIFTGREPDEERLGFDQPRFDSYCGRLSANPTARLSLQFSRGFLKSPEALEPGQDEWRTTASLSYNGKDNWATTLIWGMNEPAAGSDSEDGHRTQHSILLESDVQPGRQAFYGRIEWVEKSGHELGFEQFGNSNFDLWAFTLGTARECAGFDLLAATIGVQASLNRSPAALQVEYGERPLSFEIYLMLHPPQLHMN